MVKCDDRHSRADRRSELNILKSHTWLMAEHEKHFMCLLTIAVVVLIKYFVYLSFN